jgi:hypothetical protein
MCCLRSHSIGTRWKGAKPYPDAFESMVRTVAATRRRTARAEEARLLSGLSGGFPDQPGDLVGMRDQREVTRLHFDGLGAMRLAMKRSRSGLILRSSAETA